jgi:hypothetical protein
MKFSSLLLFEMSTRCNNFGSLRRKVSDTLLLYEVSQRQRDKHDRVSGGHNMICLREAPESTILVKCHYELLVAPAPLTSQPLFVNLIYIQFIVSWRGKTITALTLLLHAVLLCNDECNLSIKYAPRRKEQKKSCKHCGRARREKVFASKLKCRTKTCHEGAKVCSFAVKLLREIISPWRSRIE